MADDIEYTNPNLSRSIASPDMLDALPGKPTYSVFIAGVNSYRSIEYSKGHDEASDNDEIP